MLLALEFLHIFSLHHGGLAEHPWVSKPDDWTHHWLVDYGSLQLLESQKKKKTPVPEAEVFNLPKVLFSFVTGDEWFVEGSSSWPGDRLRGIQGVVVFSAIVLCKCRRTALGRKGTLISTLGADRDIAQGTR